MATNRENDLAPSGRRSAKAAPLPDVLPKPFVTHRAPLLLVARVVMLVILTDAFYVFLRVIGPDVIPIIDWSASLLPLALVAVQALAIGYVFLRWRSETYGIYEDDLRHERGIIFRKEETYPHSRIRSIVCEQSPVGRHYHYGNIRLLVSGMKRDLVLEEVPHPHHFIHTLHRSVPLAAKPALSFKVGGRLQKGSAAATLEQEDDAVE
ncbi:MAG: PH domain-containing protein [Patescibacteria group bacterium]